MRKCSPHLVLLSEKSRGRHRQGKWLLKGAPPKVLLFGNPLLIQDRKRRNAHAFNLGVRTLFMIHAVRFVCIQKCHLRAALDIQFIRMTRLDIASSARAESQSTETPLTQRIPGAQGTLTTVGRAGTKKVQKVLGSGTHDDGQQERWDQIKRGRKLSSSIMSSANLKGESDRPPSAAAPFSARRRTKKGTEQKTIAKKKRTFPVVLKNPSASIVVSVFDVAIFSTSRC